MTLLTIELDLPDHTKQLSDAETYAEKLKKEIQLTKRARELNEKKYVILYEKITRGLYYVGGLSESAFALEETIEKEYYKIYKSSPELARKLWQDHYSLIHKPYNVLKNRLYRLYVDLDEAYIKLNKITPPKG